MHVITNHAPSNRPPPSHPAFQSTLRRSSPEPWLCTLMSTPERHLNGWGWGSGKPPDRPPRPAAPPPGTRGTTCSGASWTGR